MIIHHLETEAFRNLQDQSVELGQRFNVLSGPNAQGKTNFLEAVYLIACLRSFRASRGAEMIRFGQKQSAVRARVKTDAVHRQLEVTLQQHGRAARRDGKLVRSSAVYLDGLNVVLFSPDDPHIPRGSPKDRRLLLDRSIANLWPSYVPLGRDYHKTLQSRNRVLHDHRGSKSQMSQMLDVYDQQLCDLSAKIIATRARYLNSIGERFCEVYKEISRKGEIASIHYLASEQVLEAGGNATQLKSVMRRRLQDSRAQDIKRQSTSCGPHTHDLEFRLDGRSTRSVGSQGQLRTLMLSYKIVQIMDAQQRLGDYPVLLLDDVSSELDAHRNKYLFDFIKQISCQAIITTTMSELVLLDEERIDFQVLNGKISGLE